MLETLILTGNKIEKGQGLLTLESCPSLSCLGLANNPIITDSATLAQLWTVLGLKLLLTEETPTTLVVFDIRKDCTVMDYRNTKSMDLIKDLIW